MARVRGILNDNSVASIYANTSVSKNVSSNSVLASTTSSVKRLSIEATKPGIKPSVSSGASNPVTMFNNGTITGASFTFRSLVATTNAAASGATTIRLNKLAYGTTTSTVANTLTIPGSTISSSNTLNVAFNTGDRFWVDVASIGKPNPGLGLLITLSYYDS